MDSTEDGYRVFKKKQESEEEVIFYNTDYFKRIGFPDAEVSIGKVAEDGVMKGGYYKNTENLTYPFRQFVYLIQREKTRKSEEESHADVETNGDKNVENPGFFHRMSNYVTEIGKGVQYGVDSASPYFRTSSENAKEEELRREQQAEENSSVKEVEVNKKDDFDDTNYWIVRIPIVKDEDNIVPRGKYEMEEAKLQQILREEKVDKSLGKSKRGEIYEVGSRYVRMCEEVVDYTPYELLPNDLPFSEMSRRGGSRA